MHRSITNNRSWQSVRREALEALKGVLTCAYCNETGDAADGPDGKPWAIDHVYPKAFGGTDDLRNLVKACSKCNSRKHTKTDPEWMPANDVPTAAGIPFGQVSKDDVVGSPHYRERWTVQMGVIAQLALADSYVAEMEAELERLIQRERYLEKLVWDLASALGAIESIAHGIAGAQSEIKYNPSIPGGWE